MRNRKILLVVLALAVIMLAGIGWMMMDRPHRDIASEEARFKMVPEELAGMMGGGDSVAARYLNQVVELYAVVESDDGERVVLGGGVVAVWDTIRAHRRLEEGELLRVKGRVTGYDDLFGEVRMDGLTIVDTSN